MAEVYTVCMVRRSPTEGGAKEEKNIDPLIYAAMNAENFGTFKVALEKVAGSRRSTEEFVATYGTQPRDLVHELPQVFSTGDFSRVTRTEGLRDKVIELWLNARVAEGVTTVLIKKLSETELETFSRGEFPRWGEGDEGALKGIRLQGGMQVDKKFSGVLSIPHVKGISAVSGQERTFVVESSGGTYLIKLALRPKSE